MRALVVYDSVYGNTESIARAVAEGLKGHHSVRLIRADFAQASDLVSVDLFLVGGPTQRHHTSDKLRDFLDHLPRCSLTGVSAAAFDTRYRMSMFLTGSAAADAVRVMRRAGARLVDEPHSFFIVPDQPPRGQKRRHEMERLAPGEVERARAWACGLVATALMQPV
jgi:flavodoxin